MGDIADFGTEQMDEKEDVRNYLLKIIEKRKRETNILSYFFRKQFFNPILKLNT